MMLFTQHTKSSHPMTKGVMEKIMENPNYFMESIQAMKGTPRQKPVLDQILEKNYPGKAR